MNLNEISEMRVLAYLTLFFLSLSTCGLGDELQLLVWSDAHRTELRSATVGWDNTESGAPCLGPNRAYSTECLAALQVALSYGELSPGTYSYKKPSAEARHSPYVEDLSTIAEFAFTERHRTLLENMAVELSDSYWNGSKVPACDPKRPYGNFTFYQLEMALHLELIPPEKPADYDPMTEELVSDMTDLHHQMQAALQVFLQNFRLENGRRFEGTSWGDWTPREEKI